MVVLPICLVLLEIPSLESNGVVFVSSLHLHILCHCVLGSIAPMYVDCVCTNVAFRTTVPCLPIAI